MQFILDEETTDLVDGANMYKVVVHTKQQAQFVVNSLFSNTQGTLVNLVRQGGLLALGYPTRKSIPTVVDLLSGYRLVITESFKDHIQTTWEDVNADDWATKVNKHKMTRRWRAGVMLEPDIQPLVGEKDVSD